MRWSERSRSRLDALLVAVALLGVIALAVPTSASPSPSFLPLATGATDAFTLYGDAISGWGFVANNTTLPGPHLTVAYGDKVQLTLVGADQANHNWFIDYNNNSIVDASEPSSPIFSNTNSIVWSFTADTVGTYTYRCRIHPTSMYGLITITAPTRYTLYGSVEGKIGWGLNASNISAPGPTLIIVAGSNVTLTLYAADNSTTPVSHTWFLDYNNDSAPGSGEPQSPAFGGSSASNPINWSFTAAQAGTFAYRCGIHPTQMWGMIIVLAGARPPAQGGFSIGLIPGIMLAVIAGILVLAAVYQVRATRAARLRK